MQPADEDIFDLLDRASKDTRNFGRGKFVSSNKAPALISTKGTFAGIGGSGSFRELGWASYYEYEEDEMLDYEYQEATQDKDMDLLTFRERLQKRSGVAIHNVSAGKFSSYHIIIISLDFGIKSFGLIKRRGF